MKSTVRIPFLDYDGSWEEVAIDSTIIQPNFRRMRRVAYNQGTHGIFNNLRIFDYLLHVIYTNRIGGDYQRYYFYVPKDMPQSEALRRIGDRIQPRCKNGMHTR